MDGGVQMTEHTIQNLDQCQTVILPLTLLHGGEHFRDISGVNRCEQKSRGTSLLPREHITCMIQEKNCKRPICKKNT